MATNRELVMLRILAEGQSAKQFKFPRDCYLATCHDCPAHFVEPCGPMMRGMKVVCDWQRALDHALAEPHAEITRYTVGRWEHGTIHVSKLWTDQPDWFIVYGCDEEGSIERLIGPAGEIEAAEPGDGFPTAEAALDEALKENEQAPGV